MDRCSMGMSVILCSRTALSSSVEELNITATGTLLTDSHVVEICYSCQIYIFTPRLLCWVSHIFYFVVKCKVDLVYKQVTCKS